jgi:hypothetical protein
MLGLALAIASLRVVKGYCGSAVRIVVTGGSDVTLPMTGTPGKLGVGADEVTASTAEALVCDSAGDVSVTRTEAVAAGSSDAAVTGMSISTAVLDFSTAD